MTKNKKLFNHIDKIFGGTEEAGLGQLIEDYFITYNNYYGIEKGSQKYDLIKEIHIDEMIKYVFGFEGQVNLLGSSNFHSMANNYLLNIGLNQSEIDQLQSKFCTLNASFE